MRIIFVKSMLGCNKNSLMSKVFPFVTHTLKLRSTCVLGYLEVVTVGSRGGSYSWIYYSNNTSKGEYGSSKLNCRFAIQINLIYIHLLEGESSNMLDPEAPLRTAVPEARASLPQGRQLEVLSPWAGMNVMESAYSWFSWFFDAILSGQLYGS